MKKSFENENIKRLLKHYRLSELEYERMVAVLEREPNTVDFAIFSALWNEHCSYKSSKIHLRRLGFSSPRVVQSFGENAGVVDLGLGEKVAFKMESHNHPSFIEPYQGAATGVGGILRDIFTMGARPIALADYLCFGEMTAPRMKSLLDGVVRGIGGYGNCVGVPTVSGQTEFHESYNNNILVNAMAVGYFGPSDPVVVSKASGPGNYVVYVGSKTGKDGVHGATMASESFSKDISAKKPNVQIGDPFYEKLLIESCLEVIKKGLVVAIQDMGAAGLTSSSFEMAAKGEVGFDIDLDLIPKRDELLSPEEILLSESQERMLLICRPQDFSELVSVFERWDLDAVKIGVVRSESEMILRKGKEILTRLNPKKVVDEAPMYDRAHTAWVSRTGFNLDQHFTDLVKSELVKFDPSSWLNVLSHPLYCSRSWIYEQYDQRVGARTAHGAEENVAALCLPSKRGLGVVLGCRPTWMRMDAKEGAKDAIAYPSLELASKGFEPQAVTDCLNFGSPEVAYVMSEFVASVDGLREQAEALGTPIISGNVSFYNQTEGRNITSTPATGLVGLRKSVENIPNSYFRSEGDVIWVVQMPMLLSWGSWGEFKAGKSVGLGSIDVDKVNLFCQTLLEINEKAVVKAARLVGKLGLLGALTRMVRDVGAKVSDRWPSLFHKFVKGDLLPQSILLSEMAYQVIVVTSPEEDLAKRLKSLNSPLEVLRWGETGGSDLVVEGVGSWSVSEINSERGLERYVV